MDYDLDWGPWSAGIPCVTSASRPRRAWSRSRSCGDGRLHQYCSVEAGTFGELVDLTNHIVTTEGREGTDAAPLKVRN